MDLFAKGVQWFVPVFISHGLYPVGKEREEGSRSNNV